jgi:hypothetical protein
MDEVQVREENNVKGDILSPYRVEFDCNVMEGSGFSVSLKTGVVLTQEYKTLWLTVRKELLLQNI